MVAFGFLDEIHANAGRDIQASNFLTNQAGTFLSNQSETSLSNQAATFLSNQVKRIY